jgi:hypothetical protein
MQRLQGMQQRVSRLREGPSTRSDGLLASDGARAGMHACTCTRGVCVQSDDLDALHTDTSCASHACLPACQWVYPAA